MLLNLTSRPTPIILSRNYIGTPAARQNDFVVSAGDELKHRLYDMDPASLWQGEVEDDLIDETVVSGLWLPGLQSEEDVDFLAVLGTNLSSFNWDLSDDNGSTYPGANQQVITGLTNDYKITSLTNTIAANKIMLTAKATQDADEFKQIGALVVASALYQAPYDFSSFAPQPKRVKPRSAKMHNNSSRRNFIYRSDATFYFQDFSCAFSGLTVAQADALEAVLMVPDPFIFYPEPGDKPDKMYLGQVAPGTFHRRWLSRSRSGGEVIAFDFEEAGGA